MRVIRKVLSLFMLCCAVSAPAGVLDGGEIRFRGFITDDAPEWIWRIASPDQTWNVDTGDARQEGDRFIFSLKHTGTVPFLEGYLREAAGRGGPGLTPVVTYSSGTQILSPADGGSTAVQRFRVSVPVRDAENHEAGSLTFTVEQGMAVSTGIQDENIPGAGHGMYLVSGETVADADPDALSPALMQRLSGLLLMNGSAGDGMSAAGTHQVISGQLLSDGRLRNIAAAFASALSDFELCLPSENTPSQWHATLNVTVVVH